MTTTPKNAPLLFRMVQLNAAILLFAAPFVLIPFSLMDSVHRDWLGLGSLPDVPITHYMARSLSLVYAMHGAVLLAVTWNWERFWTAVPFLACLHIVFGLCMVVIDWDAGMPWWWTAAEGPGMIAYALLVLTTYRRAARRIAAHTLPK